MAKKILAGCLAAVILIGLAWYAGFLHSDKQAKREQSELWQELRSLAGRIEAQEEQQAEARQLQEERTEASVDPDGVVNEQDSHEYYLVEEDGRVTIYRIDRETLFEYTGITTESLPEQLQEEISHGKRISGEKELYDFLENYSS
ncbi:hypothetical protein [Lachnoclostridium sp. An131]|jgi:hypothetical protein|uniref:hypothetical protein n=1 Tax=Lachnoclostridium sp. An131 TaxID=1965555 RepID=UPI00117B9BF9|nr:hypothetical protein [Lachnoclostridium sp. An131]